MEGNILLYSIGIGLCLYSIFTMCILLGVFDEFIKKLKKK